MALAAETLVDRLLPIVEVRCTDTGRAVLGCHRSTGTLHADSCCLRLLEAIEGALEAVFHILALSDVSECTDGAVSERGGRCSGGAVVARRANIAVILFIDRIGLVGSFVADVASGAWQAMIELEICTWLAVRQYHGADIVVNVKIAVDRS